MSLADAVRAEKVAFGAIEARAAGTVAKGEEALTPDQFIDRLLKTAEGADLYDRYVAASDGIAAELSKADAAAADRDLARWDADRVARGLDSAIAERLPVAKSAGDAWSQIERLAAGMVQKSGDGLTPERAVDRVLRTPEGARLYAQYVAEQYGAPGTVVKEEPAKSKVAPVALSKKERRAILEQLFRRVSRAQKAGRTDADIEDMIVAELRDPTKRAVVAGALGEATGGRPLNSGPADTSDSGELVGSASDSW